MNKAEFLQLNQVKVKAVNIDGKEVHLRPMELGDEQIAERKLLEGIKANNPSQGVPYYLAVSISDEIGELLFASKNKNGQRIVTPEDLDAIKRMPAHVMKTLFEQASALNQVTKEDLDELEKNFGSHP